MKGEVEISANLSTFCGLHGSCSSSICFRPLPSSSDDGINTIPRLQKPQRRCHIVIIQEGIEAICADPQLPDFDRIRIEPVYEHALDIAFQDVKIFVKCYNDRGADAVVTEDD